MRKEDSQVAPGALEVVRTFLNTWRIPNDTREPIDKLVSLEAMQRFYSTWFGDSSGGLGVSIVRELVRQLRADLRNILETSDVLILSEWLASAGSRNLVCKRESSSSSLSIGTLIPIAQQVFGSCTRQPVEVMLSPDAEGMPLLTYRPAEVQGCRLCAQVLALVVEAIARSTWTRLKACPDCQWVFYDDNVSLAKGGVFRGQRRSSEKPPTNYLPSNEHATGELAEKRPLLPRCDFQK